MMLCCTIGEQAEAACDTDVLGYILQTVKNKCLNYLKHIQVEVEYSKKHTELHEWEIGNPYPDIGRRKLRHDLFQRYHENRHGVFIRIAGADPPDLCDEPPG